MLVLFALLAGCAVSLESGAEDTSVAPPTSVEEVVCEAEANTVEALEGYPLVMECNAAGCLPFEWYAIQDGVLDLRGCTPGSTLRIWRVR